MILDNENENLKVHEWITKYTQTGKLSIVTGYFTVGALAYLSKETKDKIDEYKFILGDIVSFDSDKDRALDLLNEEINIDASLKLRKVAQEAVAFLELDKVLAKTLEPNFCHAKAYLYKHNDKDPQKDYYIAGSSNLTEAGVGLKTTNNVELNIGSFGSDPQYNELIKWFDNLWSRPQAHDHKTVVDGNGGVNRADRTRRSGKRAPHRGGARAHARSYCGGRGARSVTRVFRLIVQLRGTDTGLKHSLSSHAW